MNLRLQGKRALMTGVSPDIGDGVARTLAREGASVVLNGPAQDVNRIAQDITADGGRGTHSRRKAPLVARGSDIARYGDLLKEGNHAERRCQSARHAGSSATALK